MIFHSLRHGKQAAIFVRIRQRWCRLRKHQGPAQGLQGTALVLPLLPFRSNRKNTRRLRNICIDRLRVFLNVGAALYHPAMLAMMNATQMITIIDFNFRHFIFNEFAY